MLAGTGVALAGSGSDDRTRSGERSAQRQERRGAFLDDLAERLGVERTRLDAALQELRGEKGRGGRGFGGGRGAGLAAAATYLGVSVADLLTALQDKTLAEVAGERNKPVDGLKTALRDATKAQVDRARAAGRITQQEADQALERYDASIDDVINGRNPLVTRLATELGLDRQKVADALRDARLAQVDRALTAGRLTQAQADQIKARIRDGREGGGLGLGARGGGRRGDCPPGERRANRGERRRGAFRGGGRFGQGPPPAAAPDASPALYST